MIKKNNSYLWRDALVCTTASVVLAGVLFMMFLHIHIFDPFEKAFEDFSFTDIYTSQNFKENNVTNKIVLINIENYDRAKIAEAINKIALSNPKVIGLDIIFRDKKDLIKDSILHHSLQKNKNIVSAYILEDKKTVSSNPYFKTTETGFINFDQNDAVLRDFTGIKRHDNKIYYAFPVRVLKSAGLLNNITENKLENALKINYFGNHNSFLTFDLSEVISSDKIPALRNSIVLFGYMGTPTGNIYDIQDKHFTPLNSKFAGKSIPDMYGIVVHANIIKMLIDANYIYNVPKPIVFILAFCCCYIFVFIAIFMHKKSALTFHILLKFFELTISIVLLYVSLLLLDNNIHIQIEPIILLSILGLEVVILYDHLLHYLKKRWQWKSYL